MGFGRETGDESDGAGLPGPREIAGALKNPPYLHVEYVHCSHLYPCFNDVAFVNTFATNLRSHAPAA